MISDDTLTLYYYGDGLTASEQRRIDAALKQDPELAARYQKICESLDQWQDPAPQKAPAHLVQRWRDSIDTAARSEAQVAPSRTFHLSSFFWGAVVTASLAVGIGIGVFFAGGNNGQPPPGNVVAGVTNDGPRTAPVAFTRGLQVHLQQSQYDLADLSGADAANRALLIMQIIEQNRSFERAAMQHESDDIARVLRAFEPILIRMASEDLAPQDVEALRSQLAFELTVMLTKLSQGSSEEEHST